MKKILLSLALLVQFGFAMADNKTPSLIVQAKYDNVKVFQQAGTASPIIETITTNDRVELIRKWNANWALVKVNDKVGYIYYSELTNLKVKPQQAQPSTFANR
ncbi:SH3 domain-containing protein [Adhaeribacter radiodurans]|uniref:SH3 domain-containing protein n=1 Tax=Adhaeribacter radiodurans TaxID=2745197 RepID=A0A7L7L2W4_9BACT|nr:SH3 domain-containing protein [Adhaeribacter radiodurans]QMU26925.1 SH3 domain-containing protein [Adhaeribacter radiodurans]